MASTASGSAMESSWGPTGCKSTPQTIVSESILTNTDVVTVLLVQVLDLLEHVQLAQRAPGHPELAQPGGERTGEVVKTVEEGTVDQHAAVEAGEVGTSHAEDLEDGVGSDEGGSEAGEQGDGMAVDDGVRLARPLSMAEDDLVGGDANQAGGEMGLGELLHGSHVVELLSELSTRLLLLTSVNGSEWVVESSLEGLEEGGIYKSSRPP